MADTGGPRSIRKFHGTALAILLTLKVSAGTERKVDYMLSSRLKGYTKVTIEGKFKFDELSNRGIYAVSKRVHSLVFTESKWVAFADPIQKQDGLFTKTSSLRTSLLRKSTKFGRWWSLDEKHHQ